jgi:hypothetical protein
MLSPDEQPVVVSRLVLFISMVTGIDVGWISLVLGIAGPLIAAELVGCLAVPIDKTSRGPSRGCIGCASPV